MRNSVASGQVARDQRTMHRAGVGFQTLPMAASARPSETGDRDGKNEVIAWDGEASLTTPAGRCNRKTAPKRGVVTERNAQRLLPDIKVTLGSMQRGSSPSGTQPARAESNPLWLTVAPEQLANLAETVWAKKSDPGTPRRRGR